MTYATPCKLAATMESNAADRKSAGDSVLYTTRQKKKEYYCLAFEQKKAKYKFHALKKIKHKSCNILFFKLNTT